MNPVIWFEIYVSDLKRATAFYEAVLKRTLEPLPTPSPGPRMMSFPMDQNALGAAGALVQMEGVSPGGGGTLVYFASEDCAVEASRVEAAGGKLFKPKESIGQYGFIALAHDTEGNLIGFHSMK